MMDRRRSPVFGSGGRDGIETIPDLAKTADSSRGYSNLESRPRAGNLSTDTRAGHLG
jgi:hypothetical protein